MMKKNFLGLMLVFLAGFSMVFAHATELGDQDLDYTSSLNTQANENKLTNSMWQTLLDKLSGWLGNHEMRIQKAFRSAGIASQYQNLSESQMSFDSLLPKQNLLTAAMRNTLLNKLTFSITNHEMRLRELKEQQGAAGSCRGDFTVVEWEDIPWNSVDLGCYSRAYGASDYDRKPDGQNARACGGYQESRGLRAEIGVGCFVWEGSDCRDTTPFSSQFTTGAFAKFLTPNDLLNVVAKGEYEVREYQRGFMYSGVFMPLDRRGGGCAQLGGDGSDGNSWGGKGSVVYDITQCANWIKKEIHQSCEKFNKEACEVMRGCSRSEK